jgi:hypothetical protein
MQYETGCCRKKTDHHYDCRTPADFIRKSIIYNSVYLRGDPVITVLMIFPTAYGAINLESDGAMSEKLDKNDPETV